MEPLLHFVVVFAAFLALRVEPRVGLPAALFAVLSDGDVFVGIHRWIFHSLVVILVIGVPLALALRRTRLRKFAPLGLVAVLSHPILDVFSGYTPLLWPVYGRSIWVDLGINMEIGSSLGFDLAGKLLTRPTTFEPFTHLEGPVVTGAGLAITLILLSPVVYKLLRGTRLSILGRGK